MRSGAVAVLLLAVAMPSMANAGQYFVYAGSDTSEPSSGTPERVNPGRPAPQPSTSQGIYGWRALAPSEFMKVPVLLASGQ